MAVLPPWLQRFPLCTSVFSKYSSVGLFPVLKLPFPTEQMIYHFYIYIDSRVKPDKDASETRMIEEQGKLIYGILIYERASSALHFGSGNFYRSVDKLAGGNRDWRSSLGWAELELFLGWNPWFRHCWSSLRKHRFTELE